MGSDAAAANASCPVVSKDLGGKRKKANRSAKLKQCKLDARREQWLSQVKNRSCKVVNTHASHLPLSLPQLDDQILPASNLDSMEDVTTSCGPENDVSHKECPSHRTDISKHTREPSSESHQHDDDDGDGDGDDDDEDEDGALDDWEAVADTLVAGDDGPEARISSNSTPVLDSAGSSVLQNRERILRKPELERRIPRAWRFDDIFRPQSLPMNTAWLCQRSVSWPHHRVPSEPSSCPICYEDLDPTDSSFHPCCCGFRLCLFCHKRILEADGRCPGCRKLYGPNGSGDKGVTGGVSLLSLPLSRSFSMSSQS
ncbi:RING/U-box superfamily protein [Wolffia australiana]